MGWRDVFNKIDELINSKEFKEFNRKVNPNDPETALSIALRELYNKYNVWCHHI